MGELAGRQPICKGSRVLSEHERGTRHRCPFSHCKTQKHRGYPKMHLHCPNNLHPKRILTFVGLKSPQWTFSGTPAASLPWPWVCCRDAGPELRAGHLPNWSTRLPGWWCVKTKDHLTHHRKPWPPPSRDSDNRNRRPGGRRAGGCCCNRPAAFASGQGHPCLFGIASVDRCTSREGRGS